MCCIADLLISECFSQTKYMTEKMIIIVVSSYDFIIIIMMTIRHIYNVLSGLSNCTSSLLAYWRMLETPICIPSLALSGFALGFIFLSPPFSPIRIFCAIFLNLEPDFWPFFAKKEARFLGINRKKVFCL